MKTKVTPVNYTDNLEKIYREEKVNATGIEKMSITYIQPADTCSDSDEDQVLTISTQYCEGVTTDSIEKQEGYYFDISIPSGTHWSVDDGDSLKALIEDFKKRLYQENII